MLRSPLCCSDPFDRGLGALTAWPTSNGCRAEVGRRRAGDSVVAVESGEARASRLRALSAERQAEADKYAALAAAIEKGNHGEHVVAELLDVLDGAGWCVLHDRYKPGFAANLDHVVVGPPGLFVIDAKNWKPAPLRFDERGMSLRGYRKDESYAQRRTAPSSSCSERPGPTLICRPSASSPSCRTWACGRPSSTTACGTCSAGTSSPG